MAAIYKRHVGVEPRTARSAFLFENQSLPDDTTSATNATHNKEDPTEHLNELRHDQDNIFGRIANFTARIKHDVRDTDVIPSDGAFASLSPVWNSDIFSSFESDSLSSPENLVFTVAYTVEATVKNCIITSVNVVMKYLSDFPIDSSTKIQESEAESSDDNRSTISNNSASADEFATANGDQPISHRLRLRSRHKTGGLFPRNADVIYDWLAESSDTSDSDQETSKLPLTLRKQNQSLATTNNRSTVVVEYDDPALPDNDIPERLKHQGDARCGQTKDLKIVLCRNALSKIEGTKAAKRNPSRDFLNAKPRYKTKLNCFAKRRLQASKAKRVGCTPGGAARRIGRPPSVRQLKSLQTERPPLKSPVGGVGPKDELLTDLRLAMEFPRHNWLVKHLRKEKMLKQDENDDDNSTTNGQMPFVTPNSPIPSPTKSTLSPSNAPNLIKETSSDALNSENLATSSTSHDVIDHVFVTSSAPVPTSLPITEGSHMIGIVKPFHYHNSHKSKSLSPFRRDSDSDEPLQKRRKTEEIPHDIEVKCGTDERFTPPPMDCSVNTFCDVRIEKYFSLADSDHVPLDLSNKEKRTCSVSVLDLSKGKCQNEPKAELETNGKLTDNAMDSGKHSNDSLEKNPLTKSDVVKPVTSGASQKQDSVKSANGDIELYELVRKRNMAEETSPNKSKENGFAPRPAISPHGDKSSDETATTCLKKVNLTGERKTPITIIDVEALDDKLPTILPRQNPKVEALDPAKKTPPVARPTPARKSTLPQGRFLPRMQQRNISPGAASSLVELNQRIIAANYRTKSVDNLPGHVVSRFYENKPQSAPPNIAEAGKVPSPALHKGIPTPVRHQSSSVELRRPNSNKVSITRNEHFHPTSVHSMHRRHAGLPSEQSLLSPNTFMSSPQPYVPASAQKQSETERFRVPVKPTPIHYHRLQHHQQPPQQIQQPTRSVQASRFPPSHQPAPQRHLVPRANVVRAPPGGVSINSTPIRQQYSNRQMPGTAKAHNGVLNPQALKMTPEAAQRFTAHLKVQQKQLEDKIHSLKELEKKIQPVSHYPQNHMHQQHSDMGHMMGITPNMFRSNPLPPSNGYSTPVPRPTTDKPRTPNGGCRLPVSPHLAAEEKCAVCMKRAYFVCSGCRSLWYCSKTCQFQDWTKHCNVCQ